MTVLDGDWGAPAALRQAVDARLAPLAGLAFPKEMKFAEQLVEVENRAEFLRQARQYAEGAVLAFDAPVSVKELKAHLRIEPARDLHWPKQKSALDHVQLTHWLGAEFKPGESVTVTLTLGVAERTTAAILAPDAVTMVAGSPGAMRCASSAVTDASA